MDNAMSSLPADMGAPTVIQDGGDPSTPPVKRRPGRPKGSGKKQHPENVDTSSQKIKRPVGRPRKDGLPAGSVGTRRVSQPRKSSVKAHMDGPQLPPGVPFAGAYYPQHPGIHPPWQPGFGPIAAQSSISAPPMGLHPNGSAAAPATIQGQYSIDPNLNRSEWADLLRTKPKEFFQTLLTALAAPNPISSSGPSVEEAFKSHLGSLDQKEHQALPQLYSLLRTFWLPSSPAYLSLIASSPNKARSSEHRFLYWDPLPLVFNGIACPACNTLLTNRGRIRSGPIKVYDLEKPFFVIACEYICQSANCTTPATPEGRKFASTDASIMNALPSRLKDEFPARLLQGDSDTGSGTNVWNWHAMGVSKSLWNMVKGCLKAGLTREAIIHIISSIQHPLPDDGEKHEEEENIGDEPQQGDAPPPMPLDTTTMAQNQASTDEYNDAWKANTATTEPGPSQNNPPQASSSTLASATPDQPTPAPSAPPPQFTFSQPPQFATYPYAAPYTYYAQPQNPPPGPSNNNGELSTLKRPYGYGEASSEVAILEPSQKRTRHCCKCGSQDCKGKGGRSFCLNACQDCGKVDCRGRNSRRPDKLCSEAWN
ncbi:hypothetical protein BJ138DRAFT_1147499 [Hygrophoropsis aurantiaca]|uniref:Uncharacterized protein n=1 Tax=Hygrophoropsis aurantiaca TaxID=72124 RepID=A0ACB8AIM6_9AGAM|nr:hypothetical protein BJ138DRAFT_1147499 [Hygrophoropsis aurantiaca]